MHGHRPRARAVVRPVSGVVLVLSVVVGAWLAGVRLAPSPLGSMWSAAGPLRGLVKLDGLHSAPGIRDWSAQSRALAAVAAYTPWIFEESRGQRRTRVLGAAVSGNFLAMLGARPLAGRLLEAKDDRSTAQPVAVVSETFWAGWRRMGRSAGWTISLEGKPYSVVGVLPREFGLPIDGTEVWVSLGTLVPEAVGVRSAAFLEMVGRLQPGGSISGAEHELARIAIANGGGHADGAGGPAAGVRLRPWQPPVFGRASEGRDLLPPGTLVAFTLPWRVVRRP